MSVIITANGSKKENSKPQSKPASETVKKETASKKDKKQ